MMAFVLDASVALSWHFPDEASARSTAIAALSDEQTIVVPPHWFAELANGMLVGERKLRSPPEERTRFVDRIGLLDVDVDAIEPGAMFDRILPLARAHRLTVYDTLYLELAERRGLPLASFDAELNRAASSVGLPLVALP